MSDLHLVHPPSNCNFKVPVKADYLLLGGDIGNLFAKVSKKKVDSQMIPIGKIYTTGW
jgi:hypothetical protein